MCLAGGSGFRSILDPIGGLTGKFLPPEAVDPAGSLVGTAVKATGVKGATGAVLNFASGLQGTVDQGTSYWNSLKPKTTPAAVTPVDPASQTPVAQAASLNARNQVASLSNSPMALTGAMNPNQFAAPALLS